jgi:hypothetical protein
VLCRYGYLASVSYEFWPTCFIGFCYISPVNLPHVCFCGRVFFVWFGFDFVLPVKTQHFSMPIIIMWMHRFTVVHGLPFAFPQNCAAPKLHTLETLWW